MTAEEQDRIDRLIGNISEWRVELHDDIHDAVSNHQDMCYKSHLMPIHDKLDALIKTEEARLVESQQRRRWLKYLTASVGFLATLVGILIGIIQLA